MPTRAQIRSRARVKADQDNSTFPTDAQYNDIIDEVAKEVWGDLIQAGWPAETENYSVTMNGTGSYELGTPRSVASFTPNWTITASGGSVSGVKLQWLDDDGNPAVRNNWAVYYANHSGGAQVDVTIDTPSQSVTIDFSTSVAPGISLDTIKAALDATGLLTLAGTWPHFNVGIARINQVNIPVPGFAGVFTGGTTGSDQVFAVVGVWRIDGGQRTELLRLPEGSRGSLEASSGSAAYYDTVVNQTMAKLRVYPPTAAGSLVVKVIREYAGLPSDTSRWNGPLTSDQLIVLRAAIEGSGKEDNDPAIVRLERQYERVWTKLVNRASWVDMRNPPTIVDTSSLSKSVRDPFDYDIGL